jgi:hypothetical protein
VAICERIVDERPWLAGQRGPVDRGGEVRRKHVAQLAGGVLRQLEGAAKERVVGSRRHA